MPEDLKTLNSLQKEFITEIGGAKTLYYLGEIETLHATTTKENAEITDNYVTPIIEKFGEKALGCLIHFDSETHKIIMEQREDMVVDLVKKLDPSYKKALIVFGAGHNFSDNFEKKGLKHSYVHLAMPSEAFQRDLKPQLLDKKSALQKCTMPKISELLDSSLSEHRESIGPLKSPSSFGDNINNALSYYGNRLDQGDKNIIIAQREILSKIQNGEVEKSLEAWGWQHFDDSLKQEALEFVDPSSISEFFPPSAMLEIASKDEEFYREVSNWLVKHNLK